jgi:hypothetical protein
MTWPTPDPSASLDPWRTYVAATVAAGESTVVSLTIVFFVFAMLALFALGALMVLAVRR